MDAVIIGNFDVVEISSTAGFTHTGTWYEYFTGETLQVSDEMQLVTLKPGEYRIYTDVQLLTPDIGTGVPEPDSDDGMGATGKIIPNPVNSNSMLALDLQDDAKLRISIYNMLGEEIINLGERIYRSGSHSIQLDTSQLNPGIYICVLGSNEILKPIKFIKN